jgi:hypothetical protein
MADDFGVQSLTTCEVAAGGRRIRINFKDMDGRPASLTVPTDCVHQLIMTLPPLLSRALKAELSDDSVRAVFPLGRWQLESAVKSSAYILTLSTMDGFEVAFSVSACDLATIIAAFEQLASRKEQRLTVLSS